MTGLLFIITAVYYVLCLLMMCQSCPLANESAVQLQNRQQEQLEQLQLEQERYACLLRSNESLLEDFQQSVRERHGIFDPKFRMCIYLACGCME